MKPTARTAAETSDVQEVDVRRDEPKWPDGGQESNEQKDEPAWPDVEFGKRVVEAKEGGPEEARNLLNYPKVLKMILAMCISLTRGTYHRDYRDVEDLRQEVSLRVWKSIKSFKGESQSQFGRYLWSVAKNKLRDDIRDGQRELPVVEAEDPSEIESGSPESQFDQVWLRQCLESLDDRERLILTKHAQGYTLAETGECLEDRSSTSQVQRDLKEAQRKLESMYYGWRETSPVQAKNKEPILSERKERNGKHKRKHGNGD